MKMVPLIYSMFHPLSRSLHRNRRLVLIDKPSGVSGILTCFGPTAL